MERDWTYRELKEIRLLMDESPEVVAQHLNHKFHEGLDVRGKSCVLKARKTIHVLFP